MFNKIRKIDTKKENEGIWVEFDTDIKFLIAKWDNKACVAEQFRLMKPFQQKIQRGKEIEAEIYSKIINEVIAKTILLDWQGLDESYSVENAVKLLSDESLPHVREFILTNAQDIKNYYENITTEVIEQAKKS